MIIQRLSLEKLRHDIKYLIVYLNTVLKDIDEELAKEQPSDNKTTK